MARTIVFALASFALAISAFNTAANAGGYAYGGYSPGYYGGYGPACCTYAPPPPPCCAQPAPYYYGGYAPAYPVAPAPLPPPPVLNWPQGPRYYQGYGTGYGTVAAPCYQQRVRVPDGRGGWVWGVKSSCDRS